MSDTQSGSEPSFAIAAHNSFVSAYLLYWMCTLMIIHINILDSCFLLRKLLNTSVADPGIMNL